MFASSPARPRRAVRRRLAALVAVACVLLAGAAFIRGRRPIEGEGTLAAPDGARLRWVSLGSGPDTVVVLHGGPALHLEYLRAAVRPLARQRTLILYDLRGRGRSALGDSSRLSLAGDLADLEAVRTHFRLSRLTLIGHQYGAALAAHYALRHPDAVARLALVSPYFPRIHYLYYRALEEDTSLLRRTREARVARRDHDDPVGFCRELWGSYLAPASVADARALREGVDAGICDVDPDRLRAVPLVNNRVVGSFGTWDWRDTLRGVTAPTLLVQGNDDEVLGVGVREWLTAIPSARLVEVEGPTQFPWFGAADATNEAIDAFLREPARRVGSR